MDERSIDRSLALRLERAWPVFFDRFGRLTEVQRRVMPSILDGKDVLVCSATASGKTESACAPLVERYMDYMCPWTILYISPTKALINDLYERLDRPVRSLGLRIQRRTGDHRTINKVAPHVLLTTPESLDSMLCRGKKDQDTPHILSGIVAVVLDEIHLLDGTPRGEQLVWLLERLRKLRAFAKKKGWVKYDNIQIVALSATLPDPKITLRRFLPGGSLISIPGRREIVLQLPGGKVEDDIRWTPLPVRIALLDYIRDMKKSEKIIVFCNSRRRVDELSSYFRSHLAQEGYTCLAHHGSLSKAYREEAEELAKESQRVVLFATSTLEIGIDIGDIDLVVLDGPPPDLSAFLQRIGRGNRRSNHTKVMLCSEHESEQLKQLALLEAARGGQLGGQSSGGTCFAVFPQQIASYIMQSPKRSRSQKTLCELFKGRGDEYAEWIPGLLYQMVIDGELDEGPDGLRLGGEWLERAATGKIHTNIVDVAGDTVIDASSGAKIATGVRLQSGNRLLTGGRQLRVTDRYDSKIEVATAIDGVGSEHSGEWGYVSRPKGKSDDHALVMKPYLSIDKNIWPVLVESNDVYIFHLGGTRRAAALKLLFELNVIGDDKLIANEWYIRFPADRGIEKPSWLYHGTPAELYKQLMGDLDAYERLLGRLVQNRQLPPELRFRELEEWINLDQQLDEVRDSVWVEPESGKVIEALGHLVKGTMLRSSYG